LGRGNFFISGGLVALDGALKKLIKKEREKFVEILFNFCCAFIFLPRKIVVGNHAFVRPMNKIVIFSYILYERGGKNFS